MFTGIIESQGILRNIEVVESNRILWLESDISNALHVDQSVAHNGVCLTVESKDHHMHRVTAIGETLKKTNINEWKVGDSINLERCIALNGRLEGHMVQGHVDTVCQCVEIKDTGGSWLFRFQFPSAFAPLVIEKGSICLNGISLTAFQLGKTEFSVAIIPYTFQHTNMNQLKENDFVNIEFDLIGKYIHRWKTLENVQESDLKSTSTGKTPGSMST